MTTTEKTRIAGLLRQRKDKKELGLSDLSRLTGLSVTNLSFIIGDKWADKTIGDRHWQALAQWLGMEKGWVTVETPNYRRVHNMCQDAMVKSISLALSARQGSGKTYALKEYRDKYPKQVFYLECAGHWTNKDFLNALKEAIGLDNFSGRITDAVEDIVAQLGKQEKPLVILDEVDELRDPAFRFIKTFYNMLADKGCGFIICGGLHLRKRMDKGIKNYKQSYMEIYSRVGGELKALHTNDEQVIGEICRANGIDNDGQIKDVIGHAGGDLRAAQRRIHSIKLKIKSDEQKSKNSEAASRVGYAA